ncbi:MAG: PD40 domain-containing protein [Holophagales bacterium]|nr:PD40 domain-containing protein [Holophagales bacterium]
MRRILLPTLVLAAALPALAQQSPSEPTKLLRFPDVQGERVVFTYAGDLWTASTSGGRATRLTAHPGLELFAKFSPDGRQIAFTGQYDGDEQVYVVDAAGGEPKQLTYYPAAGPLAPRWGYDNQVYGWTPDGKSVLFRSVRDADGGRTETALYTVSATGGLPTKLPMPTAGAGDYSPDGKRVVYSPLFRDFRTWKRYQGGWAQDLWLFDLATSQVEPVSQTKWTERDPMWVGGAVYFVSDRDGVLNLYRYDLATKQTTELTHETTWDVRWASSDEKSQIVYELDGELSLLDTATGAAKRLAIHVPDDGIYKRPSRASAAGEVEDFELSPKGERALFVARGDVFTAPIEKGPTRNLTASSGAHDKHARWSPDGQWIAFVSDKTGEDQVYRIDQEGKGEAEALTSDLQAMLFAPEWSPDGKRLAFSDHLGRLYVVSLADKQRVEVADDEYGQIRDYVWSPDGAYLAFSLTDPNTNRSIQIWSAADGKLHRATDEGFEEYSPTWDPDGKYLYYLSEREYAPQISQIEWNYAGNRMTGVFALALAKETPHPFPAESDEVKVEEPKKEEGAPAADAKKGDKQKKGASEEKPAATKPVKIDFDGLSGRVIEVPIEADNLTAIWATPGKLVYGKTGAFFYGRASYAKPSVELFDMEKRESSTIAEDVRGWAISRDGSKLLARQGGGFKLLEVKAKGGDAKGVSTGDLMVDRVPTEEWNEIFHEVWRRYRDFFYVRNMHGYDWKAIGDRYATWLPYVAHRSDLNYVIGEMIAELSIGHAYIEGGDYELPARPKVGLPGARFELDPAAGRYRIARILTGDNAESKYRAPLTEVGVDARVGDYVLAIDGEELEGSDNPYRLLRYKTDPVTLTLNSTPTKTGAREVTYRPIDGERALLYYDWVAGNRAYVAEKTGGRVGYMHIPDMGGNGAYEFIKWYYPQIREEGMVVDVRSNGGGNISQWIIERLDSKLLGTRFGYSSDHPRTYPYTVFYGHLVCLLNETSASDGDIFPARFKKAGLGPLIGKRSWGGVVGISGTGPLLDGGTVFVPQQATNDVDGSYIIEGYGVDPDIVVDNDPASVIAGHDPQLDRGIEEVLKAMEREPMKLPSRPPDPVKTKN